MLSTGQSFAESFIPEKDTTLLRWGGLGLVVGCSLYVSYFVWAAGSEYSPNFFTHTSLGFTFIPLGLCAVLESYERLPYDTHRAGSVLSLCIHSLMWYSHGSMKTDRVDQMIHFYLSYIVFAQAMVMLYSVVHPGSVYAYLAGWAFFVLQGLWIILTGFYESWIDLHTHDLAGILVLFSMGIFVMMVLVYSCVVAEERDHSILNSIKSSEEARFLRLARTEDTDECSSHDEI